MSIIKKSLEYIKKYGFAVVLDRVKENSYIRKIHQIMIITENLWIATKVIN